MGLFDDLLLGTPTVKNLDTDTGAPVKVRAAVGSAAKPEDRLATIRKYFPDAKPYMDKYGQQTDNFVFTNPQTGRPTLYNPPGLDSADPYSLSREAAQTVGGAAGGALGAGVSIPSGPLAPVVGALAVPAASGLGAAAGGQLHDLFRQFMTDLPDSTTDGEMFGRAIEDTAVNAAGTAGGQVVGKVLGGTVNAAQKALPAARNFVRNRLAGPEAAQALQDLTDAGMTPLPHLVSKSGLVAKTVQALGSQPSSAGTIQKAVDMSNKEAKAAVDTLADWIAGGKASASKAPVGAAARDSLEKGLGKAQKVQDTLYKKARAISGNPEVKLDELTSFVDQLQAELAESPSSRPGLAKAVQRLQAIVDDATGKVDDVADAAVDAAVPAKPFTLDTAQKVKSDLGASTRSSAMIENAAEAKPYLQRGYGALDRDVNAAMTPEARAAYGEADAFTKDLRNDLQPLVESVVNAKSDVDAFNALANLAKNNSEGLLRLRQTMEPKAYDNFVGALVQRLGRAVPSQRGANGTGFSMNTFLTNLNKLGEQEGQEAIDALFSGGRLDDLRPGLDRMARIAEYAKFLEKQANTSGTGQNLGFSAFLTKTLPNMLSPSKFVASILATVTPQQAAQLMTNPKTARWLTEMERLPASKTFDMTVPEMLGRANALAAKTPDMKQPAEEYKNDGSKTRAKGLYDDLIQKGGR